MNKKISEIINRNFHEFWKTINSNKYLFHVLKGGRASAKSTHIAIWLVLALMKYPVTCLCIRKVGNTLTDSVNVLPTLRIHKQVTGYFIKANTNHIAI